MSPLKPLSVQTGMIKASPSSSPNASPTTPSSSSQLSPQVKVEPSSIQPRVPPIRIPIGRLGDAASSSSPGLTSPSSDGSSTTTTTMGGGASHSGTMSASGSRPPGAGPPTPTTLSGLKSPPFGSSSAGSQIGGVGRGFVKKWKGKRWRKWDHGE